MSDIFDHLAENDNGSSGSDIFDHLAGNVPDQTPLEKVSGWASDAVTSLPSSVSNMVSSIPDGIKNLFALPVNAGIAAEEGVNLIKDLFKSPEDQVSPSGRSVQDYLDLAGGDRAKALDILNSEASSYGAINDQLNRTFRGSGNIAATVAGAEALPVLGIGAGPELFNKVLQKVGIDAPTTPEADAKNLVTNIIQGNILQGTTSAVGSLFSKASDAVEPTSPEMQQVQDLGITAAKVAKANKFKPTIDGETPIEQAINGAIDRGVFTGDAAPDSIKLRNEAALSNLGDQVHGENGLLSAADTAIANKTVPTESLPPESLGWWKSLDDYVNSKNAGASFPDAPVPQSLIDYPRATKFIANNPDFVDQLQKQFDNRKAVTDSQFDGSLSSLSARKSQLGRIAYKGTTDSRALDQAITSDLRSTIEQRANEAVPGLGDQVGELNNQMSEHYALRPIIDNAVNKAIAEGYKGPKSPPSIIKAMATGAAKGGLAGLGLDFVAAAHGIPKPLAIANALFQGGKAALQNPTIAGVTSKSLGAVGDLFSSPAIPTATIAANNKTVSKQQLNDLLKINSKVPTPVSQLFKSKPSTKMVDIQKVNAVTPEISKAVETVESGGNENAVSGKGAVGSHQVEPIAMRDVMQSQGIDDKQFTDAELRKLASVKGASKRYGEAYLKLQLDRFDGNLNLALAAYNAGPTLIQKLIKEHGNSFDDIKSHLPEETAAYVPKVLRELKA